MATAAVMQGLWGLIESMGLTNRNKKWLADKLVVPAATKAATTRSAEDQEILDGFREAILEWKEIQAGRKQARPLDELLNEIREERKAGVYD